MDAMIFAAGHGTRLRPMTDTLPKPLIEIRGLSLIEIHLFNLAAAGFRRVIINLHHLGRVISESLGDGSRYGLEIIYSQEPEEALETAGGIVNALGMIRSQRFAAISADVLCDYSMTALQTAARYHCSLGHLIMVSNPAHHPGGDFALDSDNLLLPADEASDLPGLTYSGIAWFDRSLFETLSPGKRALRPVLEAAIAGKQLSGERHTGLWSDIGTLKRLDQARESGSVARYIDSIRQPIS